MARQKLIYMASLGMQLALEESLTAELTVKRGLTGAYTPRWDLCKLVLIDADHFDVSLPLDDGG